VGKILDAIYWHITWTLFLLKNPIADFLIEYGTAANIPLRQIPIILACLCHIKAAYMTTKDKNCQNKAVIISLILALLLYYALLSTSLSL